MKLDKKIMYFLMIISIIITFAICVYPTIYHFDKLSIASLVRINRFTGKTQVLTINKGWSSIENITEDKMDSLRKELFDKLQSDRQDLINDISQKVKNNIEDRITSDINEKLENIISETNIELSKIIIELDNKMNAVKEEVEAYKKFELDPENYFTIGSTKEDVKKIMGPPTSISNLTGDWYYDYSRISFKSNKVTNYNNEGNLRVR
jgi:DNA primase catalytic subunit